jgi:hypothetical protein
MQIEKITRQDLGAGEAQKVANGNFSNCRLIDVNGKKVLYENCNFSASIIERGYFFQSKFVNCIFKGTKFVECNFRHATFDQCTFDYADFNRCVVPVPQILANLPSWANVRWEFLHNLKANGRSIGDIRFESKIVRKEIEAEIEHWRAIRRRPSGYYEKYNNPKDWLGAWYHSLRLVVEGYVWGHGESLTRLFIATITALLILSIAHFIGSTGEFGSQSLSILSAIFIQSMSFVLKLFIDLPSIQASDVASNPFISTVTLIVRYVAIGLAIPVLYKQIAKR